MNPKFKRGYRVEILSRLKDRAEEFLCSWENAGVGEEAIIDFSKIEDTQPYYALVRINEDGTDIGFIQLKWYEEKYLKLVCCNEQKGMNVLEYYGTKT